MINIIKRILTYLKRFIKKCFINMLRSLNTFFELLDCIKPVTIFKPKYRLTLIKTLIKKHIKFTKICRQVSRSNIIRL